MPKFSWTSVLIAPRQLRERTHRWALRVLYALVMIALLAPFIANDKPLWCRYEGQWYAPAFREVAVQLKLTQWPTDQLNRRWYTLALEQELWPLIPFGPDQKDLYSGGFRAPLSRTKGKSWQFTHWLGTDNLGRDVLSGLIWGTRVSLMIGLGATAIAALLGIFMGSLAGFWGNTGWQMTRARFMGACVGFTWSAFWAFVSGIHFAWNQQWGIYIMGGMLGVSLFTWLGGKIGAWLFPTSRDMSIPLDDFVMRTIETMNAIPGLLLLLSIVALVKNATLWGIILIIGVLSWTTIARYTRGELMRIRQMEYIQAARVRGLRAVRIVLRHALPNAMGPVIVSLAFGVSGAILLESSLSFLGIGIPSDWMTWGKLLSFSRMTTAAWWLAVFPGLAIFITVTAFNLLGEAVAKE
ncbi:MAG: ABC transporter permease [Saprospiraceae bacterium]